MDTWTRPSSVRRSLQFVDQLLLRFDLRPGCLVPRSVRRQFLSGIDSTPPRPCPRTEHFGPENNNDKGREIKLESQPVRKQILRIF